MGCPLNVAPEAKLREFPCSSVIILRRKCATLGRGVRPAINALQEIVSCGFFTLGVEGRPTNDLPIPTGVMATFWNYASPNSRPHRPAVLIWDSLARRA